MGIFWIVAIIFKMKTDKNKAADTLREPSCFCRKIQK